MRILLSNDDGYFAPGLIALAEELKKVAEIVVVAPERDRSGSSNSLTLIGLGRSADASAYFLPELGIALDAGLHVSSLRPKTVLLTHGHRDRK